MESQHPKLFGSSLLMRWTPSFRPLSAENKMDSCGLLSWLLLFVCRSLCALTPLEKRERAVRGTARPPSPFSLGSNTYRRRRSDFKSFRCDWILRVAWLPKSPVGLRGRRDQSTLLPASHNPAPGADAPGYNRQTTGPTRVRPPVRRRNPANKCPHIWRSATAVR